MTKDSFVLGSARLGRGAVTAGHGEAEIREEAEGVPLVGGWEAIRAARRLHEHRPVEQPQCPVYRASGGEP